MSPWERKYREMPSDELREHMAKWQAICDEAERLGRLGRLLGVLDPDWAGHLAECRRSLRLVRRVARDRRVGV